MADLESTKAGYENTAKQMLINIEMVINIDVHLVCLYYLTQEPENDPNRTLPREKEKNKTKAMLWNVC